MEKCKQPQKLREEYSVLFVLCSEFEFQHVNHRRQCLQLGTSCPGVSWTLYSPTRQSELHIPASKL